MAESAALTRVGETAFLDAIALSMEIADPMRMKKELDTLLRRLARLGIRHNNRVVSQVVGRDKQRNTVQMRILVPLRQTTGLDAFLAEHSAYDFVERYVIRESFFVSIPNDRQRFKEAVEQFLRLGGTPGLEQFDAGRQSIIEVSRIDMNGNVLGFDLYLEIETEEEAAC